uniref:Glycoside hydrolase family protein 28 n=1 Tax=Callosobruchus maculatus TaxID=64391 RepID=E7CIQ3_CALMS|nr:glycoside hydrolase family protein 28 [Callosobruchus maculatus]
MMMILWSIICLSFSLSYIQCNSEIYNVIEFRVDPTGHIVSTKGITAAIREASKNNGGVVHFPKGIYRTGPIQLRSHVTLQIDNGALLLFEDNQNLYPPVNVTLPSGEVIALSYTPLISAFGQRNISITGRGMLDGSGAFWIKLLPPPSTRPFFLYFVESQEVLLEGVHIKNSPMYNVHFKDTSHITIKGITITNPENTVDPGPNTDGINCDPCRYLHVSNVTISTGDDAIVMKADMRGRTSKQLKPTEHVLIENSFIFVGHAGISMGSATAGGLRNITVRNCLFNGTNRGIYIKTARDRGGKVEDIHYHNITMLNIRKEGVAIADVYNGTDEGLHERNVYPQPVTENTPFIGNIEFQGIRGNSKLESIFIVGLPESPVVNITFKDFSAKSDLPIFLNQTKRIVINGKEQ